MRRRLIVIMCLLVSCFVQADVSRVEAQVDKRQVMVDEAVRLTITAYGDPRRDAFDSSALLSDFVVGRTSTSNRTSIINGQRSETTSWTTTLFPRAEGTFTIPAFNVEGQQTQPIKIDVVAVPDASDGAQTARDYYLTTHADSESVYLNQQILYTLKLFLSTDIERGSLTPPEMKNGVIKQIGEDARTVDIVNGRRYQIIERKYAIIPQRSGEMTIRGPVFTGEVLAPNTNQRFGFFNRTQTINRLGPDVAINVQPKPSKFDGHWLPSERVELHEEWPQDAEFVVGQPITRTLTLTATGVVEEQLPEFEARYPPGFKTYPDQSRTATVDRDNRLIAQRVESTAVIPTQAGKIVLPEVTIPWFDINTQKTAYATIPARSVTVAPAVNGVDTTEANPVSEPAQTDQSQRSPTDTIEQGSAPPLPMWMLVTLSAVLLLLLITVIIYYKRKLRGLSQPSDASSHPLDTSEKRTFATLKQAVSDKEVAATQVALNQWMLIIFNDNAPARPADRSLTASLQPFVDQMLASAYGNGHTEWDNNAMIEALQAVREQWLKQHKNNSHGLPPLYAK